MQSWKRGMLVADRSDDCCVLVDRSDIIMYAHEHGKNNNEFRDSVMQDVMAIDVADIAILRMMEKHESFE